MEDTVQADCEVVDKPPVPPPVDSTPPRLSTDLSRATFSAYTRGPSVRAAGRVRRRLGTRVQYRLSEAAITTFTVQRILLGRRRGRACVRPTRSNRRARRCTRHAPLRGSFRLTGRAGVNRFVFTGRLAGRTLRPGRYRLVGRARDLAGNVSRPSLDRFRIVR